MCIASPSPSRLRPNNPPCLPSGDEALATEIRRAAKRNVEGYSVITAGGAAGFARGGALVADLKRTAADAHIDRCRRIGRPSTHQAIAAAWNAEFADCGKWRPAAPASRASRLGRGDDVIEQDSASADVTAS